MPLTATPILLVVDPASPVPVGQTEIAYAAAVTGTTARVWLRILGGDGSGMLTGAVWERVPLEPPMVDCLNPTACEFSGKFKKTLLPGRVLQVRLYGDDTDPNVEDEPRPADEVTVVAVLKQPESVELIASIDQNVGGTWFRKHVTAVQPTFCTLEVSDKAPVTGSDGVPRFAQPPLHVVFDDTNAMLKIEHDLLVKSKHGTLLPGNEFHALVRVFDEFGNWDVRPQTFKTSPRKVTIDYDEVHIVNDGCFGDTEGSLRSRSGRGAFSPSSTCAPSATRT